MFKLLLISVVIAPVLLAMQAARTRETSRGLVFLFGLVLAYDLLFMLLLYYVRLRWVGL